ncbi:hypothetical protein EVAR_20895_1 [Eumeta japonica]|uniref:Uncharacterized protein n=1 Tax=Eumeta variegata TaxID=151549 RepID=A0A4C1UWS8_EUMVA|nr:hypothetical protein EVAR_20895_1 [Eumeta japonica]
MKFGPTPEIRSRHAIVSSQVQANRIGEQHRVKLHEPCRATFDPPAAARPWGGCGLTCSARRRGGVLRYLFESGPGGFSIS